MHGSFSREDLILGGCSDLEFSFEVLVGENLIAFTFFSSGLHSSLIDIY